MKLKQRNEDLQERLLKAGAKWGAYASALMDLTDALHGSTPKRLKRSEEFNDAYLRALLLIDNDPNIHKDAF